MGKVALGGAVDLHCHFGPESVIGTPHSVDAVGAAADAADLGFLAIVLKSHDFPSNAVAYAAQQQVGGVRVFGSICCDYWVGGVNPTAVETALRDEAAIVWLPTIASRQDVVNGVAALLGIRGDGIELLDEEGRLRPEVRDVLDLVAEHDAILATGHTSTAEHFAVAREFGRRGRLVVTHAMNAGAGPNLSVQECVELAELGAHIEISAATCMGSHGPSVADVLRAVRAIGPARVVLSTDYGWTNDLPRPAPGLIGFVDALWEHGAGEEELRTMACDNPARLLRLAG
ncbi:MAG TPA: DUF6282 family protein [Acidimicrobiales bacterium]|nr:DUF6282 family protein [Acidimicrobiales bacterium]